jgi:hypothetical protein
MAAITVEEVPVMDLLGEKNDKKLKQYHADMIQQNDVSIKAY